MVQRSGKIITGDMPLAAQKCWYIFLSISIYWRSVRNEEPEIHFITEVEDEWLSLNHIVDLEGTKLLDKVLLNESQIVQEDLFAGDLDEEDFSGLTGNSGLSATHYYRRSLSLNSD